MRVLVIDAGHGNRDPGAVAVHGGQRYEEKVLAWDLATLIRDCQDELAGGPNLLKVYVVPHIVTTCIPWPTRMRNRVAVARENQATHFLSIHWNAALGSASGCETWIRGKEAERHTDYATRMAAAVSEVLRIRNRGVKDDRTNRHGGLGILKGHLATTKACLLETGFITHHRDVRAYLEKRMEVAQAIVDVVMK